MKAKVYKGTRKDKEYPYYFITRNSNYDINLENDEQGKPYIFYEDIICKGEIISWSPFLAEYKSYDGSKIQQKFICPICSSHDCERPNQKKYANPHFFEGHFKCSKCGASDYNYYSECFYRVKFEKQLSLF